MSAKAMSNGERKRVQAAWTAFNNHHASQWDNDRWDESLYPGMAAPQQYMALVNRFASRLSFDQCMSSAGIAPNELQQMKFPVLSPEDGKETEHPRMRCVGLIRASIQDPVMFPMPRFDAFSSSCGSLLTHWNMDAASALVVHALDVHPGHKVLDMCAAPGGKSIAIAHNIWPSLHASASRSAPDVDGDLHCNEPDYSRSRRLATNTKAYLPKQLLSQGKVRVTRVDGASPQALQLLPASGQYDRVLLDAPCSVERHVIHAYNAATSAGRTPKEIMHWRPQASKTLARMQVSLLVNALQAARIHGRVVYATCSIDALENDGVVEKATDKIQKMEKVSANFNWRAHIVTGGSMLNETLNMDGWAEKTKFGFIVLPDRGSFGNWGPLYFSVLEKTPS